jgi:putative FmdB family regulatory protein
MPIYEYACRKCGASFEKQLKIDERLTLQSCTSCGERSAALIMSAPSRVGGTSSMSDFPTCPSTGAPCGCGNGGHHH